MYLRTHIRTDGHPFVHTYPHTHARKTGKLYAPGIIRCGGGHKNIGHLFLHEESIYEISKH